MKIAIIGYGQMGKEIQRIAEKKGHKVVAIIDPFIDEYDFEINKENLMDAEVCIEFTHPDSAIENYKKLIETGIPVITGTTGWLDKIEEIKALVLKKGSAFMWGSNYSIGVNTFFKILEFSTKLFNNLPDYDIFGFEAHHMLKKDSPSGTAKTMTDIILNNIDRKEKPMFDSIKGRIKPEEFHFASLRGGSVIGSHSIYFDSFADEVEIKHSAKNRTGLAHGAVLALEWIEGKKGFFDFQAKFNEIVS